MANRYRSLQQVFRWLAAEDEIRDSPMASMRSPAVPDEPPPVLRVGGTEGDLMRLAGWKSQPTSGDHGSAPPRSYGSVDSYLSWIRPALKLDQGCDEPQNSPDHELQVDRGLR